ncbi:MAG: aminopeptidase P family protein [Fuerstiella sp.]|nr:aminopeptidase P family protein [Fuerstiella sp.]
MTDAFPALYSFTACTTPELRHMANEPLNLLPKLCRVRQQRVQQRLVERSVDQVILADHANIQYLTGFRPHHLMQAAVCLDAGGRCTLSAPNEAPESAAVDEIATYPAQWCCTLRQDQAQSALDSLVNAVGGRLNGRVAVESSVGGNQLLRHISSSDQIVDADHDMWQIRRRKEEDELAMIRRAIECTEAMYVRAREIIEPGICELEVFNQLQSVAVNVAGEPLTALGNDFQCNSAGGPPRARKAGDGELYILDLGPAVRGYYADNCRTVAVNGRPSDKQVRAWQAVVEVLELVESIVKPGVSCRALFKTAQAMLDDQLPGAFFHHLGHGFGLYPHEAPHLNPHWDDTFEEGDCFTAEPGLYSTELKAGIRLEQNYRVTSIGVERLTHSSLKL